MKTLLALFAVVVLVGCATREVRPPPVSPAEVVSMTKQGVTDDEIIRLIIDSRSIFRLSAEDVVRLRTEGVSSRVIDVMLDTYVRYSVNRQRADDYYDYDYGPHYGVGFYYGRPYHRW